MLISSILMILLMIFSNLIMFITSILSKKTFSDREKNSPFECGFDPKSSARVPFSLQFFLIAIIFLIFDIEIAIILPIIVIFQKCKTLEIFIISSSFMFILLMGLYHEWNQGALEWSK